jgi:plastocyanin
MTPRAGVIATLTAGALIFAACGGDATPRAEPSTPRPTTTQTTASPTASSFSPVPQTQPQVSIVDNEYRPAEITVASGGTVVWVHQGTAAHSATAKDGSFDSSPQCNTGVGLSQCMQPGQTFPRQFNTPGRFEYWCRIHQPLMAGVVVVT